MDNLALFILCNTFPSVVTLWLRIETLAYDDLANLVRFLSGFSHLRTLDIRADTLADLPRTTSLDLSTHLRHLSLFSKSRVPGLPQWVISLPDRPALRTLSFGRIYDDELDAIVEVLSLLEDSLESLSFWLGTLVGMLSVFLVDNLIDLRCIGLGLYFQFTLGRKRSLRVRPDMVSGLIKWLAEMLSRLSSIHMDEMVLDLYPWFNDSLNPAEWRTVDDVLQQLTFSRLRKFEIRLLTSATAPGQIPVEERSRFLINNLPQCNARGILCFSTPT